MHFLFCFLFLTSGVLWVSGFKHSNKHNIFLFEVEIPLIKIRFKKIKNKNCKVKFAKNILLKKKKDKIQNPDMPEQIWIGATHACLTSCITKNNIVILIQKYFWNKYRQQHIATLKQHIKEQSVLWNVLLCYNFIACKYTVISVQVALRILCAMHFTN